MSVNIFSIPPELVLKYLGAIGGTSATLLTFFSGVLSRIRSKVEITKDEGALIDFALKTEGEDAVYQKFLKDIIKEKTVSLLFDLPIRTGKIGALMELYNQGGATLSDIRKAWPYMSFTNSGILFLHDVFDIISLWFARLALAVGLVGTVLGCLTLPFTHGLAAIQNLAEKTGKAQCRMG